MTLKWVSFLERSAAIIEFTKHYQLWTDPTTVPCPDIISVRRKIDYCVFTGGFSVQFEIAKTEMKRVYANESKRNFNGDSLNIPANMCVFEDIAKKKM